MKRLFVLLALLLFTSAASLRAENWPEFRGPTCQGIYAGKSLPTEWSPTTNVAWKKAIPGKGWSTPIVQDGRVYLTTAVPGVLGKGKDQLLCALCLDATTGELLWQTEIFKQDGKKAPGIHTLNSHASPSPLTDGKRLWTHFGHQGTACLDLDGNVLWRNTELRYSPVHGNGGSPIRVDNRLIFSVDGSDQQFVAALDCDTGKVAWKTDRKSEAAQRFSFGTPLLVKVAGKKEIVSCGSDVVTAYDANDGKELWRLKYNGYSQIPRPVQGHGMIYLSSGFMKATLMAIRVDGAGDGAKGPIVWSTMKSAPLSPSPLLVGDELYTVSDNGIASCFDAKTGKIHWQQRVEGNYWASPIYGDGKIYLQNEEGVGTVLRAGTKFEVLAHNTMGERTFASYAAADGAIFLRTEGHLYRIQTK